jgi:hypothetical protein
VTSSARDHEGRRLHPLVLSLLLLVDERHVGVEHLAWAGRIEHPVPDEPAVQGLVPGTAT